MRAHRVVAGRVTNRDAQWARVRRREARWCWRRWDLTINMMWGERVGGGKMAKTTTEEWRCREGKDRGEMVAGGGRLQSLQGEKSCLHLHGCSASRDKVSGFATPNDDGRSTLAWSGGVWRGQKMQNLYCSYLRQVGMQVPPWGARCIRVKMGVEH